MQTQPGDLLRTNVARLAGPWWLLLVTGIAWLIISMVVLRFTTASAATIGVLLGVVFVVAMANEFLLASMRSTWRWAHGLMGLVFLAGAVWAFISPYNAFWALASAIGLLFVLQGALVLITSFESKPVNSAWWLGVLAGVLEVLIGFWASQQVISARAALLIFYAGFLALFRGITEIVFAFELKAAQGRSPAETGVPAQRETSGVAHST
jgi:uncharacterized membrane protein HdeD (DUF308 family)